MMIKLLMVVPAIYQLVYTSSGKFEFSVQPIFEGGVLIREIALSSKYGFHCIGGLYYICGLSVNH